LNISFSNNLYIIFLAYSLGIALPSWLVDANNAFFVLALYGAGFGLLIPFLVSQSWSTSKKYTKEKILQSTMAVYFQSIKQRLGLREILELVCMSHEFLPEEFNWSTPFNSSETERLVNFLTESKAPEKFVKPKKLDGAAALRVYCLLFAHVHRISLPEAIWFHDQTLIVSKSVHLLSGILKIAMVREWSVTALNTITLTQFFTQACWENQLPLIQLPSFNLERAIAFASKTKASTVRTFLELSEEARNAALEPLNLASEQKENLIRVSSAFPDVSVLDVSFQILGQEEITPEGVVTCAVKLKLTRMDDAIKLDLSKETEKARKEKVDVDQFEFDEDGNMVESAKTTGSTKVDPRLRNQPIHAPFFPAERKTNWWIFLLGQDMQTFVCPPVKIADLVGEKTVTMQFPTPPRPGQVSLRLLIRSDCLYGADILMDAKFTVVKESQKSRVVESDWDISDTESESENPFAHND
jgi:translocation protein SEC63